MSEFSETLKDTPTKFFGTVRQEFFDGNSWYSLPPPPSLLHKNFRHRKFSETQHIRDSTKYFGTVRQKKFRRRIVITLPSRDWKLSMLEFFSNTEGFPHEIFKFFGTVRQKIFDRKARYSSPFLFIKFFDTRNFLKHRSVPVRKVSVLWDKRFRQNIVIVPSPPPTPTSYPLSFSIPKFSEAQKCSSTKNFGTVRQKLFDRKS